MRVQESPCIYDGVISNLPIMRWAHVALIVLFTVFSMAWYKTVMQRSLVECQGNKGLCLYVYREMQVTCEILHGKPRERIA